MAERNGLTNSGSILESDEIDFQRPTLKPQQQFWPTERGRESSGRPPGSVVRGVTVADGAAPRTRKALREVFTDTDFQRNGSRNDEMSSSGLGGILPRDSQRALDRYQTGRSDGKMEEEKLVTCLEGSERNTGETSSRQHQAAPAEFLSKFQTQGIKTEREIPRQRLSFPISFPMEPDYLHDADIYAPAPAPHPTQPLTSGEFILPSYLFPTFLMDQRLHSSSSGSYNSFSSSSSFPSGIGASVVLPGPQMDSGHTKSFDMGCLATGIASTKLDDMEMDGAEMETNQCEEIYDDDPENTKPANQHRRLFQQNTDGDTILHLAIIDEVNESTMMTIIRLFREQNLLNVLNNLKQTPLHLATITGQDDVIAHLLKNGARRKVFDRNLDTPLHIACRQGHVSRVKVLHPAAHTDKELDQESRDIVESSNKEGQTCLHLASIEDPNGRLQPNRLDVVRYLIEGCKVNVNLKELRRGRTILHLAVERRNSELVRYLLNLPPSHELLIDDLTYDCYSALQMAQLMNETRIEKLFLLAGVQPIMDVDIS